MLEIVRTLTLGATAGTLFAAALAALPIRSGARLTLGALVGAWVALVLSIAGSGAVKASPFIVPVFFALPLLAAGLAATSAAARAAMLAIPAPLVIALNTWRVLGVFMLLAGIAGTMSGPFPYIAGIGDIITGLLAIPVARIAAKDPRDVRVLEWNIFGAIDLVVAVFLGMTSVNGGPLQLIHAGAGSDQMTMLPWALIPLVLVPTYLIGHALVFARILSGASHKHVSRAGLAEA